MDYSRNKKGYPTPVNAHYKDSGSGQSTLKQGSKGESSGNKDQSRSMCQAGRSAGGSSKSPNMYAK